MTVLDTSIPYEKVLMVMARKTIRKEIELNPKFHYVEFDESLKEAWCKLQTQVCLFENIDEARNGIVCLLEIGISFLNIFYLS